MGACTMASRSLLLLVMGMMILGLCQPAWAQSPTYGLGRTPTAEEIRALISLSVPTERNSRRAAEAPRKVRRSMRRSVRHATGQQGPEAGLLS